MIKSNGITNQPQIQAIKKRIFLMLKENEDYDEPKCMEIILASYVIWKKIIDFQYYNIKSITEKIKFQHAKIKKLNLKLKN